MNKQEISMKEFDLNLKHQNIIIKDFMTIGYEFERGVYIFGLLIPKKLLNIKGCKKGK